MRRELTLAGSPNIVHKYSGNFGSRFEALRLCLALFPIGVHFRTHPKEKLLFVRIALSIGVLQRKRENDQPRIWIGETQQACAETALWVVEVCKLMYPQHGGVLYALKIIGRHKGDTLNIDHLHPYTVSSWQVKENEAHRALFSPVGSLGSL